MLSKSELGRVLEACETAPTRQPSETSAVGRRPITALALEGLGRVVIKHYFRGGLLSRLMTRNYFRLGRSRAEAEFNCLARVRALGIAAPEPIGYITRGGMFYRNWLITREIPRTVSLAEWATTHGENIRALTDSFIEQVSVLIQAGVFHVDLHPGNVLLDDKGKIWLLDFDKAASFSGRPNTLRDNYLVRWRRAVLKHGLPEILSEYVAHGLRRNFEASR